MAIPATIPDRSLLHNVSHLPPATNTISQNTAPNSLAVTTNKKNPGFLSTLASYLTSTAKSDPKPVVQRRKLMSSWDDVDLVKLNKLVCNVLYESNSYEPLIIEIERVVGRRREYCLYSALSFLLVLVLLHDAIGAITAFMTLIVPAFITISVVSSRVPFDGNYVNQWYLRQEQDYIVKYWTVYAAFVPCESFISSLIQWDLRLLRLVFLSACLSSRIPILDIAYYKLIGIVLKLKEVVEQNNYESAAEVTPNKSK